jgi:uncharacterized protein
VVDKDAQEKIDVVKSRLIRNYGYCDVCATDVLNFVASIFARMGSEQKEIVRIESSGSTTGSARTTTGVQSRYIIHDAAAREVDRDTFFTTREAGGTKISTAYELAADIASASTRPRTGTSTSSTSPTATTWAAATTRSASRLLRERLLPVANLFGYGQVESRAGSGAFSARCRRTSRPRT